MSASEQSHRDKVLVARLEVMADDAERLSQQATVVELSPPPANATTERAMRLLEGALADALDQLQRLREFNS